MHIHFVNGEIVLSEVYTGIGIQTDMGLFGIAQRDAGIEVQLNGKPIWTSHETAEPASSASTFHQAAAAHLDRIRSAVMQRMLTMDINQPTPSQRRNYLQQAIEAIDTTRRLLHETFSADNDKDPETTMSPYFRHFRTKR